MFNKLIYFLYIFDPECLKCESTEVTSFCSHKNVKLMKSSVLMHAAVRTSQGFHFPSKIRESPAPKTKNTSASKFSPARDHMQLPSYIEETASQENGY